MTTSKGKFLLDTQIFLWYLMGELPQDVSKIIEKSRNIIYLSTANVWEIILKRQKGKLKIPGNIKEVIKQSNFGFLSVDLEHVLGLEELEKYHQDPFDRILISQAKKENLILITSDKKIWRYKVKILRVSKGNNKKR